MFFLIPFSPMIFPHKNTEKNLRCEAFAARFFSYLNQFSKSMCLQSSPQDMLHKGVHQKNKSTMIILKAYPSMISLLKMLQTTCFFWSPCPGSILTNALRKKRDVKSLPHVFLISLGKNVFQVFFFSCKWLFHWYALSDLGQKNNWSGC